MAIEVIPGCISEDRARVLAMFDVSRETVERIDRFVALLLDRQRTQNLISNASIDSLWMRHVADSLQLLTLVPALPSAPIWVDIGSGGGFPGLVIACAAAEIPGCCVHLVESSGKKAAFLRHVVREIGLPAIVHGDRIETVGPSLHPAPDFVTARAVAPLPELCGLIAPLVEKGAKALLLKGQSLNSELTEAAKSWHIDAEIVPSRTSENGRILIVRALSRRPKS